MAAELRAAGCTALADDKFFLARLEKLLVKRLEGILFHRSPYRSYSKKWEHIISRAGQGALHKSEEEGMRASDGVLCTQQAQSSVFPRLTEAGGRRGDSPSLILSEEKSSFTQDAQARLL